MKKYKLLKSFIRCCKGAISVFLSLMLTGVCSLSALVIEAGRYKTAQQVFDEAAITSALSSLANIDSTLQKRFGLYGVKTKDGKDSTTEEYMKLNSDFESTGVSALYNLKNTDANWTFDLANYSVLERQILEHEKYRAPLELIEDFANIDKFIKDLVDDIEKLIPGLKEILDICTAICDIVDGLKALYSLTKTIQQLEMSTVADAPDFSAAFADAAGKAWGKLEEAFGGDGWEDDVAKPSYYKAYNDLNNAISEKVNYLKSHTPAPTPPTGSRPVIDSSNKNKYDELFAVSEVINLMINNGYFDEKGLISGNIDNVYDTVKKASYKNSVSYITNKLTREDLISKINENISEYSFEKISKATTKDGIKSIKESIDQKKNGYYSTYNTQKSAQATWDKKNAAYNEYVEAISSYNTRIDNAVSTLNGVLEKIGTLLSTYKTNYNTAVSALEKATQAVKNLQNAATKLSGAGDWNSGVDITKVDLGGIEIILNKLKKVALDPADEGILFVGNQKDALSTLSGEKVDVNYGSLSSHTDLGKGKMANYKDGQKRYYLTKTEMAVLLATLEGVKISEAYNDQIIGVFDSLRKLQEAFGVLPALFDKECCIKLSSETTSLFPSMNGTRKEADIISSDIDAVRAYLDEAKTLLGSVYNDDIGLVHPDNTSGIGLASEELSTRIGRIADNCQKLSGEQDSLLEKTVNGALGFLGTIFKLFANIGTIIQLIEDFIYVVTHIKDVFTELPSMLGESVLINQFAVTKFSNRLDKVKGETGVGKSFAGGVANSVSPAAQTFSQANLEYIVIGGTSEASNQQACFNRIMALRMINNAILIASDEVWMELIGACNILAPVVFILLMYYESNIDMNLLIKLKMKVPLIKTSLVLSIESTKTESLEVFEKTSEELTVIATDDSINIDYTYSSETSYYYQSTTEYNIGLSGNNGDKLGTIEDDLGILGDDNSSQLNQFYAQKELSQNTKNLLEGLEKGKLKLEYRNYLFLFMLLQSNRQKVMRMADLIQMELRYKEYSGGKKPTLLLQDYHTFVRVNSNASLNSVLPIISLGKDGKNKTGWNLNTIKYVGY